ncbi:MAG: enoyl-CoA hydratase [Salinirussus sp.]|jgi:enoyl-CoA hydratase
MPVTLSRDPDRDHVAHLELSAGDLNLLSPALIRDLRETAADVPAAVAVLTVTGDGDGLTGGLELDAVRDHSATEARSVLRDLRGAIRNVRDADAVTVCGCGGYALGAGLELAMACDFRVAEQEAALGLPEVDVGLVTGIQGGLLVRLVGLQAAKEMIYTGEPVSGEEAAELGLLNRAVPAEEHDAALADRVGSLARKSPLVLRRQKEAFRAWRSVGVERGIDHTMELIAACFDTHDQSEGMNAFLEGREPTFRGG